MNHVPEFFGLEHTEEIAFYLETLVDSGFLSKEGETASYNYYSNLTVNFPQNRSITFKGLSRLAEIENEGYLSNKCFVAMPFDKNKESRIETIKKACKEFNYDAFPVYEYYTKDTQTIDSKIIAAIKSSKFIIADFTGINQGAYLEAGYAMGRNMKVIFLCEESDFDTNKKHFDVNHYPFIKYKDFDELYTKLLPEIEAYIQS